MVVHLKGYGLIKVFKGVTFSDTLNALGCARLTPELE